MALMKVVSAIWIIIPFLVATTNGILVIITICQSRSVVYYNSFCSCKNSPNYSVTLNTKLHICPSFLSETGGEFNHFNNFIQKAEDNQFYYTYRREKYIVKRQIFLHCRINWRYFYSKYNILKLTHLRRLEKVSLIFEINIEKTNLKRILIYFSCKKLLSVESI